jgi:hypothetical protein
MLQRALFCSLWFALSGCDDLTIAAAYDAGSTSEDDAGSESEPETPPLTQLDETLARYANEVAGEWYGMSLIDSTSRFKATLSPSSTQPRNGSAEYEADCPAGNCPPDADGSRSPLTGPGNSWVGEYWFLRLKGPNADLVLELPVDIPIAPICTYVRPMKKLDCGSFVLSRTRAP